MRKSRVWYGPIPRYGFSFDRQVRFYEKREGRFTPNPESIEKV